MGMQIATSDPNMISAVQEVCVVELLILVAFALANSQVNIAQFHPFPGQGIVYGTKRGKVRTFSKS
jgi:hypothetical protein